MSQPSTALRLRPLHTLVATLGAALCLCWGCTDPGGYLDTDTVDMGDQPQERCTTEPTCAAASYHHMSGSCDEDKFCVYACDDGWEPPQGISANEVGCICPGATQECWNTSSCVIEHERCASYAK